MLLVLLFTLRFSKQQKFKTADQVSTSGYKKPQWKKFLTTDEVLTAIFDSDNDSDGSEISFDSKTTLCEEFLDVVPTLLDETKLEEFCIEIPSDEVTSNNMGNFERFHFSKSATNVFLETFFLWISRVTSLNCVVVVFDPNIDLKLRLSTLFLSTDLSELKHKYLTLYISMMS